DRSAESVIDRVRVGVESVRADLRAQNLVYPLGNLDSPSEVLHQHGRVFAGALAKHEARDQLCLLIQGDEKILVADGWVVTFRLAQLALFLQNERPNFVALKMVKAEIAHLPI